MISEHRPPVAIASIDVLRLKRTAEHALFGFNPVGKFLLSEIDRASIHLPSTMPDCVRLDEWVDFHLDEGEPMRRAILVMPERFWSDRMHVSILSPLGAALLGLRAGDRMPYEDALGRHRMAIVVEVPAFGPKQLGRRGSIERNSYDRPPDDGPTAA